MAHYRIRPDHPPLLNRQQFASIQRKSKLLPSPIGQCPGDGCRTVTQLLSFSQLFIGILLISVTEICTALYYSAVSVEFFTLNLNGL